MNNPRPTRFDWLQFLERNNVDYRSQGKNVSRGNVAIACPLCGDDPSEHMVISTQGHGWWCWRNRKHQGRSPVRLVQALLHCSFEHAHNIVQGAAFLPDDFHAHVMSIMKPTKPEDKTVALKMPDTFRPLGRLPSARPYVNYLLNRGYTEKQIKKFNARHGIVYCTRGAFQGRVILPIYFEGRLVTWTGRAVSANAVIRYKTLSTTAEKAEADNMPVALGPITNYLLWWDDLMKADADTIILCEGPFDALKIWTLGLSRGIVATCFFTQSPGPTQIDLLHELLPRFKRRCLLLDMNTVATQIEVTQQLQTLDVEQLTLPKGCKDPGEMTTGMLDAVTA